MSDPARAYLLELESAPGEAPLRAAAAWARGEVPWLVELARGRAGGGPWARVGAVRQLAWVEGPGGVSGLLEVLAGCEGPSDRMAEECAAGLLHHGGQALSPILDALGGLEGGAREVAVEVAVQLALDYLVPGQLRGALQRVVEEAYRGAVHPGDRALYASYLGDLGEPAAAQALWEGLRRPGLTVREYEAAREALERLDQRCPEFGFDVDGTGYPLDLQGRPVCPGCGQPLRVEPESERFLHQDGRPPCVGWERGG